MEQANWWFTQRKLKNKLELFSGMTKNSALDKKQPGVLVIHGKPGDKADIELLEGTLYKQVILKSKKEKIIRVSLFLQQTIL